MSNDLPTSYRCKCGVRHQFPGWVYAHWDMEINHDCECGRRTYLKKGKVLRTDPPRKKGAKR